MASFKYEAVNREGETVTGRLEADEETGALEKLRGMGLMATDVKEIKESPILNLLKSGGKVKLADLSLFSRQMSAMLNSGIPLTRALYTLSRQVNNPTLSKALEEIASNVEGGASFSEALKGYPNIFSELYINMISAGETGGNLEATLNRLSIQLQKDKELRDNIKSASFYPVAVLAFAVVILFAMLFFLVPIFVSFFPPDVDLPLPTQFIISMSDNLQAYWYLFIPGFILIFFALRSYAKTETGKRFFDRLKLRLPIFGELIQKSVVASFARTFSTMMSAGLPIVQALDASGKSAGNTMIFEATQKAGEQIQEGSSVAAPLEESGFFPPMVTHMISVGEETGDIPEMMDKVASFFEEEVSTMTKSLTSLIEPVMLVVVGVLVGGMLIALYLPMFTLITQF
ncbi:MAG: type II secretion system F family protein [Bacillota bacterium]